MKVYEFDQLDQLYKDFAIWQRANPFEVLKGIYDDERDQLGLLAQCRIDKDFGWIILGNHKGVYRCVAPCSKFHVSFESAEADLYENMKILHPLNEDDA